MGAGCSLLRRPWVSSRVPRVWEEVAVSSYVLFAVKVPVTDLKEGLCTANLLLDLVAEQPYVEGVILLNTIPAPGCDIGPGDPSLD